MVSKKQIARKALIKYWQDVAERAGWTFIEGYAGWWLIAAGGALKDRDFVGAYDYLFTVNNLRAGVVVMAISIVKSRLVKNVGEPSTASILPK